LPAPSPSRRSVTTVGKPSRSAQRRYNAQEHLGPVLAFGAAGAGVDGDDGAELGVVAGEQHGGLDPIDELGIGLHVALDIGGHALAFFRQLEERVQIVGHGADADVAGDGFFQPLAVAHHLLALLRLRPEVRSGDLLFGLG